MSNPLLATSVARRMFLSPVLKELRAPNRFAWSIFPCIGRAGNPKLRSMKASRCAALHVATKTMIEFPIMCVSHFFKRGKFTSAYKEIIVVYKVYLRTR